MLGVIMRYLNGEKARGMISKFVSKVIFQKFGCKIQINIRKIYLGMNGDKVNFHIDTDGQIDKDEFCKIVKQQLED